MIARRRFAVLTSCGVWTSEAHTPDLDSGSHDDLIEFPESDPGANSDNPIHGPS